MSIEGLANSTRCYPESGHKDYVFRGPDASSGEL
jgi:hypothetical protein